MRELPANIILEKNKTASPNAWLILLEITLTDEAATVLRFVRNDEDILFTTDNYNSVGCIAHWKLNDNEADKIVVDASGNNHIGEASANTNIFSEIGKINRCFNMTADSGGFVTIPNHANFNIGSGAMTFCAWVKAEAQSAFPRIFEKRDATDLGFFIVADSNNRCRVRVGNGSNFVVESGNITILDGTWHFVVVVIDKKNDEVKIYVDSVLDKTIDISSVTGLIDNTNEDLYLGASYEKLSKFTGKLDNMIIFNKELLIDKIISYYNLGNGTESILASYTAFPFEIEPTKNMSKGQIPTVTLRVSNITNLLEPYLESLDGAIGSTVKITVVNSNRLEENYSELELTYEVLACNSTAEWVTFTLGAPNPLRQRFPLHKYLALHCSFRYNDIEDQMGPRCQYVGKTITNITKAANAKISVTNHGFAVDDVIKFADVLGMTEINGKSGVILNANPDADGNAFTVDIDSEAFSDYISGGKCGYATCKKTLAECRIRSNSANFGGFPGIRSGSVRIA